LSEEMSLEYKKKFKRLNLILREMRQARKVTLALQWARDSLSDGEKSDLTYQLLVAEFR